MEDSIDSAKIELDGYGRLVDNEKIVGSVRFVEGKTTVHLNITYETTSNEWVVPISHLIYQLKKLPEYTLSAPEVGLVFETAEEDVEILDESFRRLDEKTIKGNGYKWCFHKSDADTWPSLFHGHDYEKGLKLDLITGKIFDSSTKKHCETLKERPLRKLQAALRESPDFAEKARIYLPHSPQAGTDRES